MNDVTYREAIEIARRKRIHGLLVVIHERAHPTLVRGCEECGQTPEGLANTKAVFERIDRLMEEQRRG